MAKLSLIDRKGLSKGYEHALVTANRREWMREGSQHQLLSAGSGKQGGGGLAD